MCAVDVILHFVYIIIVVVMRLNNSEEDCCDGEDDDGEGNIGLRFQKVTNE